MKARIPVFEVPNFRFLFFARLLLGVAGQMQTVAIGWQIYTIKHDPLYLGLIGLAEAVPAIGISLYAGHVVDRRQPLRIYLVAVLACLFGATTLALVSSGFFAASSDAQTHTLFAVVFLTGIARGFIEPAQFSLLCESIPREQLRQGVPWMTATWQVATIVGPAIAGLGYAFLGASTTYGLVSLLTAGAMGFQARLRFPKSTPVARTEPLWESLASGLKFVFSNQIILGALSLDMFAVLFGGATSILPMYVDRVLHQGSITLGILRAAPSVGAILMATYLVRRPISRNAGRLLLAAVAGFGLCIIGFGLSRSLLLSASLLLLSGAFDNISVNLRQLILQLSAPADMRGRISAVNSIFIGSSNEIGEFESGMAARMMGLVPSILFGGCASLFVVALVAWLAPRLRELDIATLEKELTNA